MKSHKNFVCIKGNFYLSRKMILIYSSFPYWKSKLVAKTGQSKGIESKSSI